MSLLAVLGLALAALVVGISKTSIGGFGVLAVAVFALVLPTRESTAAVLLLLIVGDVVAVARFRRAADWGLLRRLLPAVLPGVVLGAGFLAIASDLVVRRGIGVLILLMLAIQLVVRRGEARAAARGIPAGGEADGGASGRYAAAAGTRAEHPLAAVAVGVAAGFATMTANAAGAVTTLYLLAMRVDKLRFIGTNAWFFLLVNLAKTPFSAALGLFPASTLALTASLAPVVLVGTWVGLHITRRIGQLSFERASLSASAIAGLALLVR